MKENYRLKNAKEASIKTAQLHAVLQKGSTPVLVNLSHCNDEDEPSSGQEFPTSQSEIIEYFKDSALRLPYKRTMTAPIKHSIKFEDLVFPTLLTIGSRTEVLNMDFWAAALTSTRSVLYENSDIQIGICIARRSDFWMLNMYIENKSRTNIENLKTKLLCPHNGITMKINVETEEIPVLPKTATHRAIAFQLTKPFTVCPAMKLTYNDSEYSILLPITYVLEYHLGVIKGNEAEFTLNVHNVGGGLNSTEDVADTINFYGIFHKEIKEDGRVTLECANIRFEVSYLQQSASITVTAARESDKDMISSLICCALTSNPT